MDKLAAEDAFVKEIVHRLKDIRRMRSKTQQEVYDATGIHVGRLEAQRGNITLRTLAILCHYYEITPTELLQGSTIHRGNS